MSNLYEFKPFLWRCAVLLLIIFSCAFIYRTGSALYDNHQLREQFSTAAEDSLYQQGTPLEKMDLTAHHSYLPNTFDARGYTFTHRIKTPVSLRYYTEIPSDDADFALEIAKGTTIVAIPEGTTGSAFHEPGYGYTSYPTYEKGWRYARPFNTAEGLARAGDEQHYYVKLGSLEVVVGEVIKVNQPFHAAIQQQGWSINKGTHVITRYIDNALYQHGAYLSPDLSYPVFDRLNVLLLSTIGMIVATILVQIIWARRKNRVRNLHLANRSTIQAREDSSSLEMNK